MDPRGSGLHRPHHQAAVAWLSIAPGPAYKSAAASRPSIDSARWPTAYTPG